MVALKRELKAKATALLRVKDLNCLATGYDEMLKQSLDAHVLEKMIMTLPSSILLYWFYWFFL